MTRRRLLAALTLLTLFALGACTRSMELTPDESLDEGTYRGNIRVEDRKGVIYNAQAISETDEGDYLLEMVEVVNDGVVDHEIEVVLTRSQVVSIRYRETNRWAVVGMVTSVTVFMVWLYYKINTDVFD